MIDILKQETQALRESDKDPIAFAIEAIRINISVWAYKDETILYEAMKKLEELDDSR
jgi:translation elongation factor EF-1beta